ncbi:uncharacterized protein LOC133318897 isoform X2 [Danaus plexippus]|uniref:uncharacterized protein LOC133318897 isoform X2 n=1 Tax=Danaus plexippus TaxID=13037 RepID=UPI002AAF753A|nr:uncharacterized protein LOC133318897 isoform X2 [Danaus plexippus]
MADIKQLKYLLVQVMILLSIIAITGHLSGNYWERYVRRREISRIKSSLNYLKDTVTRIGSTYDILHEEVAGLSINPAVYVSFKEANSSVTKNLQVFFIENSRNDNFDFRGDGENLYISRRNICNATTITKYPLKATGVGDSLVERPTKTECKHSSNAKTATSYS